MRLFLLLSVFWALSCLSGWGQPNAPEEVKARFRGFVPDIIDTMPPIVGPISTTFEKDGIKGYVYNEMYLLYGSMGERYTPTDEEILEAERLVLKKVVRKYKHKRSQPVPSFKEIEKNFKLYPRVYTGIIDGNGDYYLDIDYCFPSVDTIRLKNGLANDASIMMHIGVNRKTKEIGGNVGLVHF